MTGMAQQLNLFDPRFAPQAQRFSARHAALAVVATLGLAGVAALGLHAAALRADAQLPVLAGGLAPLTAQLKVIVASAPAASAEEMARLQALDAGQRRMQAALASGVAGAREGHADLLLALARQTHGALWITGLTVSDDGAAIDLEGRMTDTAALTDYLRRLDAEPRFKGRAFAQLSLKGVDANGAALPYAEFALRSAPAASQAAPP
jgi:Tfp pilus assembly protein PilN